MYFEKGFMKKANEKVCAELYLRSCAYKLNPQLSNCTYTGIYLPLLFRLNNRQFLRFNNKMGDYFIPIRFRI